MANEEQIKSVTLAVNVGVKTIADLAILENSYARKNVELITLMQDILRIQNKLKIKEI